MRNVFGPQLKDYREKNGMTMADLNAKANGNLSTSSTSTAENEANYNPRLSTFIEIYRFIDKPFDELLEEMGYGKEYQSSWYRNKKREEKG
ncbi:helix-turn-helix transcriptional regulator [Leuconostoc citreum]